ncbi:NAD-dependent epimerase [Candidatus Peregrinibacteria bacterium CG1_02_54_53]|nr:MAG: NAD-dependent epimerase [Candidatus Peregrinibacteria bacterium CG1_02_54_53]
MPSALITGGSGFFGGLLKRHLLKQGWECTNIDLVKDEDQDPALTSIQGDIRDKSLLETVFGANRFDSVFHCAAILAHGAPDKRFLWTSNVDGTRNIAEAAARHGVKSMVYTSSNCLWGESMNRPIREDDPPHPIELYGRSKWEGERVLEPFQNHLNITSIRCPTIMDAERLGLLAILFEFIADGRKVWVVGKGDNRYQFIYAGDLIAAFQKATELTSSEILHIGSDDVKSLRDVYEYVTTKAGTGARIASLPKLPTLFGMRIAYWLKCSPLGPYHYKMIAENFEFDTSKIKRMLSWQPTLRNEEMLWKAYEYFAQHREELKHRSNASAHRQPAKMGIIRLLKWLS